MSDWSRVRELFEQAVDLADKPRTEFLERACDGDTELRDRVERLLEADTGDTGGPVEIDTEVPKGLLHDTSAQSALIGHRIGAYEVKSVLGTGGMGTVFEAEQDQPRRRVALKVMRLELTSSASRRRFEYESEVLGRLRHAGIAQVHEAGTWNEPVSGLEIPFFAMELVEGAQTLDRWAHGRPPREVLKLFCQICDAVQHGHQVGVLHRDLKPANVLVDEQGQPKIIDFGIARTTDVSEHTELTRAGQALGTMQYMSPEQLAGAQVDTRSDVYALGTMLYEHLAGRAPFETGDQPLHVYAQRLQKEEPVPPSKHGSSVPADLDWIVLRAIAKDPAERYPSVSELAADLQRFLREEPVVARPPSQIYALRKFVRRNRRMVAGAAVMLVILTAATVISTTGWVQASRAEEQALLEARTQSAFTDFTLNMIRAAREQNEGEEVRVVDFLARADDYLEPLWTTRPRVAAAVQNQVVNLYLTLDRTGEALTHAETVLSRSMELLGPDHSATHTALHGYASALSDIGRLDEAESVMREALAGRIQDGREELAAYSRGALGQILDRQGKYEAAEAEMREALEWFQAYGEDTRAIFILEKELVELLSTQGRLEEALRAGRDLLAEAERVLGQDDPTAIGIRSELATTLRASGQHADAEALTMRNLELARARFGPTSQTTLSQLNNLAAMRQDQGKWAEAEQTMREVWRIRDERGDEPRQALISLNNLSILLERQDKLEEAEEHFKLLLERAPDVIPATHWLTGVFHKAYGVCLHKLDRYEAAEKELLHGVQVMTDAIGRDHWRSQRAIQALVDLYEDLGRVEEAEKYRAWIVG